MWNIWLRSFGGTVRFSLLSLSNAVAGFPFVFSERLTSLYSTTSHFVRILCSVCSLDFLAVNEFHHKIFHCFFEVMPYIVAEKAPSALQLPHRQLFNLSTTSPSQNPKRISRDTFRLWFNYRVFYKVSCLLC